MWTLLGSRENFKIEKCLKMRQNPTRQVHPIKMAGHPVSRKKPPSGVADG
jgi:hypothetical protein